MLNVLALELEAPRQHHSPRSECDLQGGGRLAQALPRRVRVIAMTQSTACSPSDDRRVFARYHRQDEAD